MSYSYQTVWGASVEWIDDACPARRVSISRNLTRSYQ